MVNINASENFSSMFERGITGVYHSASEAHLRGYLAEFDFRHNHRFGLSCEDEERDARMLKAAVGKRLM